MAIEIRREGVMVSLRNVGTVIAMDDDMVALVDEGRNVFHRVARGPGTHFWVDAGFNGNHNFVDCPQFNDVIHFVTSKSITDGIDFVAAVSTIGNISE
jgi:hypothetical protein